MEGRVYSICACLPVGFYYTDKLRVKVLTEERLTPCQLMLHHRSTTLYSLTPAGSLMPFGSAPRCLCNFQIRSSTLPINVFKFPSTATHTHTHYLNATQYPRLAGLTYPFTSPSHQTWHEAAGYPALYLTSFGS